MTTAMAPAGALALVLHPHLPYDRDPGRADAHDRPLFEALLHGYIPLIEAGRRLEADGVPFRLTLCVSPSLVSLLDDEPLRARFLALLDDETRERCDLDVLAEWRRWQEAGWLDLATATPGFLPLSDRGAMRAQVAAAVAEHVRVFGRAPQGIWLARHGYATGAEQALEEAGLRWCLVDGPSLLAASSAPVHGVLSPIALPGARVAAYAPDAAALHDAQGDAGHMLTRLEVQARTLRGRMDRPPISVLAFEDGHLPAPAFIEQLFRHLRERPRAVEATTPSAWLDAHPQMQEARPAMQPIGWACGPENDWLQPHLHNATERLRAVARRHGKDSAHRRALQQASRELLLAGAADWPAALHAGTDVDAITWRVRDHLAACHRLCDLADGAAAHDEDFLGAREARWPAFPDIDPATFAR